MNSIDRAVLSRPSVCIKRVVLISANMYYSVYWRWCWLRAILLAKLAAQLFFFIKSMVPMAATPMPTTAAAAI